MVGNLREKKKIWLVGRGPGKSGGEGGGDKGVKMP